MKCLVGVHDYDLLTHTRTDGLGYFLPDKLEPDRPFHNFKALQSGDRPTLYGLRMSFDGF